MNFLAHLYLSANDTELRIGNFIGDHVKGRSYNNFPDRIREGILLHRKIDEFTDKHELVKWGQNKLREAMGRYASVVIDVLYDHILASNWQDYHQLTLGSFSKMCYDDLMNNFDVLPKRVQQFLPLMIASNRLVLYATTEGLRDALVRMSRHTSLPANADGVIKVVNEHRIEFEDDFRRFFAEIILFVEQEVGLNPLKLSFQR